MIESIDRLEMAEEVERRKVDGPWHMWPEKWRYANRMTDSWKFIPCRMWGFWCEPFLAWFPSVHNVLTEAHPDHRFSFLFRIGPGTRLTLEASPSAISNLHWRCDVPLVWGEGAKVVGVDEEKPYTDEPVIYDDSRPWAIWNDNKETELLLLVVYYPRQPMDTGIEQKTMSTELRRCLKNLQHHGIRGHV